MSETIRYITDDTGKPIGVLLDLEVYRQLANPLLTGNGIMSAYIPVKLQRRLREKFGDRCAYCHNSSSFATLVQNQFPAFLTPYH
jgi:hypothetical protein